MTNANGAYAFANLTLGTVRVAQVTPTGWRAVPSQMVTLSSGANTANFANFQLAAITGRVVADANGDGVLGGAEAGISGATVFLDANGNAALDAGEASATTDASGNYRIANLLPATYSAVTRLPSGTISLPSTPASGASAVTIGMSGQIGAASFGFRGAGLFGGDFSSGNALPVGWSGAGETSVNGRQLVLGEVGGGSSASYTFIVPAGPQFLSFIVPALVFVANGPNPPDAQP